MHNEFRPGRPVLISLAAALLIAAFTAPALVAAPAQNPPQNGPSAVDSLGRSLALKAPAKRIISLSPEATEALYAVGAGRLMVGDTTYCDYPPEAKTLAKIGGFSSDTISVEQIVALRPDLVVSAGKIHQPVEAALTKLGIPVYGYLPTTFEAIEEQLQALGRLAGTADQGRAAALTLHAALEKAKALTSSLPPSRRPAVFWQVYDEPLMTCGADSFPHQVIELAGGRDIFADIPGPWPVISSEEVLRRSPEYILSPDDMGDLVDAAKLAARPGWSSIPAVRDKKIVLLPANLISRAGPRIADGVLAALKALHPELVR